MSGYNNLKKRLDYRGGARVEDRMVADKLWSMKSAIHGGAYQQATVLLQENQTDNLFTRKFKALINPDKLKNDYDQKIISIPYKDIQLNLPKESTTTKGQVIVGLKPGDVFYWEETDSYWIVYSQYKEELAYFRGDIRECEETTQIGEHIYHIYFKDSDETTIPWKQKGGISANDINYSAIMYITQNDETLAYLHRFAKLKINGVPWEVAAVDRHGGKGIIEVALIEDYSNTIQDEQENINKQEEQLKEQQKQEIIEQALPYIDGPDVVYPFDTAFYTIKNVDTEGTWILNTKKAKVLNIDSTSITIEITTSKSGSFNLQYIVGDQIAAELSVTIGSL